jgi:hypothetical protein
MVNPCYWMNFQMFLATTEATTCQVWDLSVSATGLWLAGAMVVAWALHA